MTTSLGVDQIISLGACIGAFLSAIAAFLAVRQSSIQRVASYKPELVVIKTVFEGLPSFLIEEAIPISWVANYKGGQESDLLANFSIPIKNVGLGAAKGVVVTWSFQIENVLSQVNDVAQRSHIASYFEYCDGSLTLKTKAGHDNCSFWSNQKEARLDYILPAAADSSSQELIIPQAFIQLVSSLIAFSNHSGETTIPEIPILRAQISYFDIGGKKYSTAFRLKINLVSLSDKGQQFGAYLEAESKA